jgi:hypothetical protein
MAGFVEGVDRGQSTLLPALLDDYVAEDNPVRAVDVFVDGLDLDKRERFSPLTQTGTRVPRYSITSDRQEPPQHVDGRQPNGSSIRLDELKLNNAC